MSAGERDPIFDTLDRLAGLADAGPSGDRMPDIRRRVQLARRRRTAALGAAVVALVVVGVWQLLPGRGATPLPAPPHQQYHQQIHVDARTDSAGGVSLTVIVEGTSTGYVGTGSTAALPAGPQSVLVLLDGRPLRDLGGRGGLCRPSGEASTYSLNYPARRELRFSAGAAGTHTIEVRAPYCADGELVDDTVTTEITTAPDPVDPPTVSDITADVDGDGAPDSVRLTVPAETAAGGTMTVDATWSSGGSGSIELPRNEYAELGRAVDLDGDGSDEVIVAMSGGDTAWWSVLREADGRLVEIATRDESGGTASLENSCIECGGGPVNETWVTTLLPQGFYDYRFVDAHPPARAPVELRRWVLSGDTLTRLEATSTGCYVRFEGVTPRPC